MAQLDIYPYEVTSANAAAGSSTPFETQQPGGAGSVRQVITVGDAVTRANIQTVKAASTAAVAADMGAVVHLHPSSPMSQADTQVTGTISATDTLGGIPAGNGALISTAPSANSFVAAVVPGGSSSINIQITGTPTGSYWFEYSMDSTTGSDGNWAVGNFRLTGSSNTVLIGGAIPATLAGIYRGDSSSMKMIRVRNTGGTSPSNPIIIRESNGSGSVFLNASIPAGSNTIGGVTLVDSAGTNKAAISAAGALSIQGYQPAPIASSAITATGPLTAQSAQGFNIATVTLRTFTGTTPSITFKLQGSDDNTNWKDLQGIDNTSGQLGTTFTQAAALSAGTAGPSIDITVGAYTFVRINVTAISGTTPSAVFGLAFQTMPYEASPGVTAHGTDGVAPRILKTSSTGQLNLGPQIAGGLTTYTLISAATTNAASVKASAGQVYGIQASNTGAANAFLKLYNKASAPTVGSDTAVKTLIIPAGGGIVVSAADIGMVFGTGIALAITGVATTADTTAVALAQVVVNLDYQ